LFVGYPTISTQVGGNSNCTTPPITFDGTADFRPVGRSQKLRSMKQGALMIDAAFFGNGVLRTRMVVYQRMRTAKSIL